MEGNHSQTLEDLIKGKIRAQGGLSFPEFMELALYEPEYGYYSRTPAIGRREGDFYTSVSVGPVFGILLGYALEAQWRRDGAPEDGYWILEQGAHDGQLALDILDGLAQRNSPLHGVLRYGILESRAPQRTLLGKRLGEKNVTLFDSVDAFIHANGSGGHHGLFLCNELVDAFPAARVRFNADQGEWEELYVVEAAGKGALETETNAVESPFVWETRSLETNAALRAWAEKKLGPDFPDGYVTEICLAARDWVREIAGLFGGRGAWWIIDYGMGVDDYLAPERRDGTLRCYRDHRATDDPFSGLGETDITTHVNFTWLAEWAEEAGLKATPLADQHTFLTRAAMPWLQALEQTSGATGLTQEQSALVRQFQTLTHPGMMGRVFKVLVLERP